MSCEIYTESNEKYSQFIVEDKICKELKLHNISKAIEVFDDFFSTEDFVTLGGDFKIRTLKNHMICLLVSTSRTLNFKHHLNIERQKIKNSLNILFCNRYIKAVNIKNQQRPTLPSRYQLSTISARELNFCVRYGNRCDLSAFVTGFIFL